MTQDEIIEMAKQSGIHTDWEISAYKNELQHFAKLIAEREREACAKACEEVGVWPSLGPKHCAEAIRARGQA